MTPWVGDAWFNANSLLETYLNSSKFIKIHQNSLKFIKILLKLDASAHWSNFIPPFCMHSCKISGAFAVLAIHITLWKWAKNRWFEGFGVIFKVVTAAFNAPNAHESMQKGGKSICTHDLIKIAFKKWGLFSSFQAIFKVAAAAFSALNAHESMQKGGKSICTHDLINIAFRKWGL